MNVFAIIAVFFILLVVASLLLGLGKFAKEDSKARIKSQFWMRMRVLLQLLAVIFLILSHFFPDIRI